MEKTTVHDNLHTEVMENVIYIQMLGGFSMTYHAAGSAGQEPQQ